MTEVAAFEADRAGDVVRAIELYEVAVAEENATLDTLISMAVLYWQITDYGFWTGRQLPSDLVHAAGSRMDQVLDLAASRFPGAPEVAFWRKYIAWADLGEPFDLEDCRDLLKQNPDYLEPVLYLFAATGGKEGMDLVPALLEQARRVGTHRSRYIVSVIEAGLRRQSTDSHRR